VRIVTPEELVLAPSWAHVIDEAGARTRIRLANGEVIGDPQPVAVFNRLRFATAIQFDAAATADREYATMELHALLQSWLASFAETLTDFLVVDIEVEHADPVPAAASQVGGAPAAFYPNWFEGAPGTTVSAAVRRDAPGADLLAAGRRLRCRMRGAGPGGAFIQPDSLLAG
jgi:hypothetical protein